MDEDFLAYLYNQEDNQCLEERIHVTKLTPSNNHLDEELTSNEYT